jgi:hypothetical protein
MWRTCAVLTVLMLGDFPLVSADPVCGKGLQGFDGVCLPDKTVAYLVCINHNGQGKLRVIRDSHDQKDTGIFIGISGDGHAALAGGSGAVRVDLPNTENAIKTLDEAFNPTNSRDCLLAAGIHDGAIVTGPPSSDRHGRNGHKNAVSSEQKCPVFSEEDRLMDQLLENMAGRPMAKGPLCTPQTATPASKTELIAYLYSHSPRYRRKVVNALGHCETTLEGALALARTMTTGEEPSTRTEYFEALEFIARSLDEAEIKTLSKFLFDIDAPVADDFASTVHHR